ncbi:MAG: TIGR02302 family protein, partial [Pararhizobium sp.]
RALWTEHRRRMAERIQSLRTGLPEPDTPRRDPYALRALVVLLFVTAFAYSYSSRSGFISDAFVENGRAAAVPVRVDAWVTPPAYTGEAPIFLTQADEKLPDRIAVPEGSAVTVRVSGGTAGTVTYGAADGSNPSEIAPAATGGRAGKKGAAPSGSEADTAARTYAFKATRSGTLTVAASGPAESWTFDVIPDKAPEIAFAGEPTQALNGALELTYTVKDDYGIEKAKAEIIPAEPPRKDAHPLYGPPDYPLTIPGGGRSGKGRSSRDITDNPLSGKRVKITLVATDAAGHVGRSATKVITLPEHNFGNPLARAVAEERQTFALDTNQMPRALDLADALTVAPEEISPTHYLLLRSARTRMTLAGDDDEMRDAADYLWQIALGIDNGDLSLAQQRLRDAQRALSEALKNHASDKEISRLMKELRQAMNDLLKEMARNMPKDFKGATNPNGMQQVLRQQDLERMLDQIENLARSGQRDQAEQLLSELQQMMNDLQAGRPQQGRQGDNGPMRQQMDKLGRLMQQQQRLMDQTFDLNRQLENGDRQNGEQQQGQQGQQGQGQKPMTEQELRQALKELRKQQENLKNQLGEVQKGLKGLGIKPGKGFGEAGQAMGKAGKALGQGEGEQALGEQGRALEALRQGAQDMMSQMQAMQGQGEGQGDGPGRGARRGDQYGENNRDPLGRPRSTTGPDFGDNVKVPDEIDIQRAREILNQIRKRLGNNLSPALEKQYLERLLDMN